MKRQCTKCKKRQARTEFHKNKRGRDGLQPWCKTCQRAASRAYIRCNREKIVDRMRQWRAANPEQNKAFARRHRAKKNYGLSLEDYDLLVTSPCAICGKKTKRQHLDHCHAAGHVRGVLCSNCNAGLGMFMDDPTLLQLAIQYLKSTGRSSYSRPASCR